MWLFIFLYILTSLSLGSARPVLSRADFMEARERALAYERVLSEGGDMALSPKEELVNKMILAEKEKFIEEVRLGNTPDLLAMHFSRSQPLIANTSIYKFIQKMPKGGVLHIHDSASVSLDWLVKNVTYREHLYMCQSGDSRPKFKFADRAPPSTRACQWRLLSELRNATSDVEEFDDVLKKNVSLLKEDLDLTSMSDNELWAEFLGSFGSVDGLVFYSHVFGDYVNQALTEFHRDNVQYMEIRILLQETYNLNGSVNGAAFLLETYRNVIEEFKKNNPTFSGAKVIVTDIRYKDKKLIANTISEVLKFRKMYPDLIVGFDLVSQEDLGHSLLFYLDDLMDPNKNDSNNLPYYFHAGETNFQGTLVDRNLIDAVLLGTRRIGHGFAIVKHPWVMEEVKKRQIAIEVNPFSNQVLGLVSDLKNHPAASLIAQNFPIVISCDDPPMWGATGLSYDFYAAFMAMTGADTGLKFLKGIAMNSLKYSAMTDSEKDEAEELWSDQWHEFIDEMAGNVTVNVTSPPEEDPVKPTKPTDGSQSLTLNNSVTLLATLLVFLCVHRW